MEIEKKSHCQECSFLKIENKIKVLFKEGKGDLLEKDFMKINEKENY